MTVSMLRTAEGWWVQTASGAAHIPTDAATTRQLLADRAAIDAAAHSTDTVPVDSLKLLSPITTPCRVVAQATNYASHVKDVGPNACDLRRATARAKHRTKPVLFYYHYINRYYMIESIVACGTELSRAARTGDV
jgi:2-keto-4-pentenoate hydratase/2-oxohepta-3-ene-1,7-dioic acid hydratase in catechol pathway